MYLLTTKASTSNISPTFCYFLNPFYHVSQRERVSEWEYPNLFCCLSENRISGKSNLSRRDTWQGGTLRFRRQFDWPNEMSCRTFRFDESNVDLKILRFERLILFTNLANFT